MKNLRAAIFLLLLGASILSAQEPTLPNIVILYADDMGVGDVSYGDADAKIQTPNIDRIARQGMTFSDGHSSSGICTCLLYTSPSPRDRTRSRMPSSA